MKAKSIIGKSTEEIKTTLEKCMATGYKPTCGNCCCGTLMKSKNPDLSDGVSPTEIVLKRIRIIGGE